MRMSVVATLRTESSQDTFVKIVLGGSGHLTEVVGFYKYREF